MKIAVTGGTGFIGNYVVQALLQGDNDVIVTGMNVEKAKAYAWFNQITFIELDINNAGNASLQQVAACDRLIHLAWSGLPDYKNLFHFEQNLYPQYLFLKKLIALGLTDITVTGTCFEYGMKEGGLSADMPSDPQNPYALAKDTLRKFLQQLQDKEKFTLKWLRLFYMYGKGQSEKSILSLLQKALDNGEEVFNMSGGQQQRDYLPVEEVAKQIVAAALSDKNGIFNISSGKPVTIKKFVEDYLAANNKSIKLNLGYYPYTDYEPMHFWGIQ